VSAGQSLLDFVVMVAWCSFASSRYQLATAAPYFECAHGTDRDNN